MHPVLRLAAIAVVFMGAAKASAQSVTYNFEDLTDDGFGHKFSNDASETFPVITIVAQAIG